MTFSRSRSKPSAFTLIELLIVVAIIGILAAIAVPNFLQAQMRAKVAKAVNNMRSISTALETYFLDQNTYPRWAWDSGNPANDYMGYRDLTTPIAYISGESSFENPFRPDYLKGNQSAADGRELDPKFEMGTWKASGQRYNPNEWPRNTYLLESAGPDAADDYNAANFPQPGLIYQTTNGLLSQGDIYRSGGAQAPDWSATLTY